MRRRWPGGCAGPLAIALVLAGCGEELGPIPLRTARVSGVVLDGGTPLPGGFIEFRPVEGTVGNLRSAPIGPDGRFEADRVAVGRNVVAIVAVPPGRGRRWTLPSPDRPIRRVIPERPGAPLRIDLLEEAYRNPGPTVPEP